MADERHRRTGLYMDYELENWRELRKYKMCQPIADMLDEAESRGRADSVQKLVEALGCTPQQAMGYLQVPEEDQPKILEKLQEGLNESKNENDLTAPEEVQEDCNEELKVRWFELPRREQMSIIGMEVAQAVYWKKKGDCKRACNFCNIAIELLIITEEDPKNSRCAVEELNNAVEELRDYFLGNNIYETTDEVLMHYYGAFLCRKVPPITKRQERSGEMLPQKTSDHVEDLRREVGKIKAMIDFGEQPVFNTVEDLFKSLELIREL